MRTLKDICVEECCRQGIVVRESGCQGDHHPGLKTGLEDLPFSRSETSGMNSDDKYNQIVSFIAD